MSQSIIDTTDGRRLRSQDSKRKIVAAMLELVREGQIAPTAEEVAQRAEVGLRTVFRRFKDMESLYAEMAVAISEQVAPIIEETVRFEHWSQNFSHLVERRLRVYEVIMPYRVAAEVLKFQSNVLHLHHLQIVRAERELLRSALPSSYTKDKLIIEGLEAVLSFDMWNQLRNDQNLKADEANDVIIRILSRLLPEAGLMESGLDL
jgi:AcrR family transcriptional regulator